MDTKNRLLVVRYGGGGGEQNGLRGQKYKFPGVKQMRPGNVMYSTMIIVNSTALPVRELPTQ